MEHGKAGRKERISARGIDADVARVGRLDGKPGRIVECAAIDAADIGEPLEDDIEFGRAYPTGMDVKPLATALGGVGVDRGGTTRDADILWSKDWLNHVGSTGCPLAEPTVTDRDAARLSLGLVSHGAAEAPTLVYTHDFAPVIRTGRRA